MVAPAASAAPPTSAAASGAHDAALADHAVRLCQTLLRIDTTNPPGNERAAADVVFAELAGAGGLDPRLIESGPGRANVVARLRGTGAEAPLLLTAHLDVVEADPSTWTHPPFSGVIADGCLWGRGAIDMKNMAAMCVAIITKLARQGVKPRRDIIFAAVADEEAGCDMGSRFLCEQHPELVRAEYAIGESGGFSLHLGKSTFYPVQVAEKGICWVRARVRGEPGHGSMPREDSAVLRLAKAVARLERPLPVHITPWVSKFIATLAARTAAPLGPVAEKLLHPRLLPRLISLLPDRSFARSFAALVANTASPTVLRAGAKINVIPGLAEVDIDGRTLPGQSDAEFLAELRAVLGPDVELEVLRSAPPTVTEPIESPLWSIISDAVLAREPDATVVPYMIPGFTDAKYFTTLGAKWYGFSPVKLPRGIRFADMFHGNDERIPVDGLGWGANVLMDVVRRFAT